MDPKSTKKPAGPKASEPKEMPPGQTELSLDELAGVAGGTQQVNPKIGPDPVPHKHVANVKWTS